MRSALSHYNNNILGSSSNNRTEYFNVVLGNNQNVTVNTAVETSG